MDAGTQPHPVPSSTPGGRSGGHLACNASAVGYYTAGARPFPHMTLAEHWNGTTWTQVPSPNPSSSDNFLGGVAAHLPCQLLGGRRVRRRQPDQPCSCLPLLLTGFPQLQPGCLRC